VCVGTLLFETFFISQTTFSKFQEVVAVWYPWGKTLCWCFVLRINWSRMFRKTLMMRRRKKHLQRKRYSLLFESVLLCNRLIPTKNVILLLISREIYSTTHAIRVMQQCRDMKNVLFFFFVFSWRKRSPFKFFSSL
jgi:hypothetical protein